VQERMSATIMRGGTSRGVFFLREAVPPPGELRDRAILAAFGSPDPYGKQIDGVGGATSVTSKVVLVGASEQPDCDVDYFFGQVDIRRPIVDYTGSCGNLSSAVGPFAIEKGLVEATDPFTTLRIWQVNTQKRIIAHVPTKGGVPEVEGDFVIDGVPFAGARIRMEYLDPGGSCTRGFLPTGQAVDTLEIPELGSITVSLVDATNPVVFVRAVDLGLKGTELGDEIDSSPAILEKIELVRSHGAVLMGLASSAEEATRQRPGTPKVALVSPPADYSSIRGTSVRASEVSLVSRIMSMGKLHRSYAVTGGIATATAALVEGSVVNQVARIEQGRTEQQLRIGHPSGILPIEAKVFRDDSGWICEKATAFRTARMLMDGNVCIPASVMEPQTVAQKTT
jgi:2-methylaconitate cis-trans-isomerase PrpF